MISTNKIIISKYQDKIILCKIVDDKLNDIYSYGENANEEYPIGTIVNGRIEKNLKDINASFARISNKVTCFINDDIKCESVIPVQIKKDAYGEKRALVSSQLSIPGEYVVVFGDENFVRFASKAHFEQGDKEYLEDISKELKIGIIIRSKACNDDVNITDIESEIRAIYDKIKYIKEQSANRLAYHVFYKPLCQLITDCITLIDSSTQEIVTDIEEIYDLLSDENESYFGNKKVSERVNIRLYNDKLLSLGKLYSFESKISEVLSRKIHLKNGANITFDQTEALLAIDVNSAKANIKHSNKEAAFLEININAAKEIFRQIRLRQYSGIIIIDFINMKEKASYDSLKNELNELIKRDNSKSSFYGFTALGLCEISRQKTRKAFTLKG